MIRHPTTQASSGPPDDTPKGPAPPLPPRWRPWLLPVGLAISILLLLTPVPRNQGKQLTYSEFLEQVEQGNVRSVRMRPDGHSQGTMGDGSRFVTTMSVTGSSFVEIFVGVSAARVRDLFAEARRRAPAIVFIDEVDAIGQRRSGGSAVVANDEREQTLNPSVAGDGELVQHGGA